MKGPEYNETKFYKKLNCDDHQAILLSGINKIAQQQICKAEPISDKLHNVTITLKLWFQHIKTE